MKTLPALNSESLRSRLKLKHLTSKTLLLAHHPHVKRLLTSGALVGTLLVTSGQSNLTQASLPAVNATLTMISAFDKHEVIKNELAQILPPQIQPLNESAESKISDWLHQAYGIHAVAELEGNRLNTDYGLIGVEQHLPLYPGDSRANVTPGRGAWGYFAYSQQQLTDDLLQKEKYYVAVQTLYLPDWQTRLSYLRDWYKYRKVVLVNPKNGKTIVADIADSGPAAFTGKHFGGSPEVMDYLQMHDGKQRGPVILFFVDDPDNSVPLGPLEQNLETGPAVLSLK